jgi:pimeloyl-ACP methyl ester carboxylesterase
MERELSLGRVHYEIRGSGSPIVVLHGGPGDVRHMQGVMEPVFDDEAPWQRIYFDLPGNGRTKASEEVDSYDRVLDFVLEFIDSQLPDRRFALVGLSYGGYLARGVLHERPNRVAGMCLIVPRVMQDRAEKTVPEHKTLFVEDGFHDRLKPEEIWMRDILVIQTREHLEAIRQYISPALSLYDAGLSDKFVQASPGLSIDVDNLAAPVEIPVLIVTGRQDSITGFRDIWPLLRLFPRATYATLDQAGHFLGLIEQKRLFQCLTAEWLDRLNDDRWWNSP